MKIEEVESGKLIIPFLWRELDIRGVESLRNLDIMEAKLNASRELSSVLSGLNLGINEDKLSSNPISPVLSAFLSILSKYLTLLDSADLKESDLQDFLDQNPILISPSYLRIHPQAKLGIDSDSPALIIIGRKKSLSSKNLEDLASISKDYSYNTQVLTYDDVYERALAWYNNLKKLEEKFSTNQQK